MAIVSALRCVTNVYSFSTDEKLIEIIRAYKPDVYCVGSDWYGKEIVGAEYLKEIKYIERDMSYASTTERIQNITNRG
jgi:bifunctional ADP-heptose synthase (sugar kinase/adenylyltransferase)